MNNHGGYVACIFSILSLLILLGHWEEVSGWLTTFWIHVASAVGVAVAGFVLTALTMGYLKK